jgi:hypothetical protein
MARSNDDPGRREGTVPKMLMPLAGRSRVDESRCHTGYTGHYSLVGTYSRLSRDHRR